MYNNKVLEKINILYNDNLLITYGNPIIYNKNVYTKSYPTTFSPEIIKNNDYQHSPFITQHLRTGRAYLFKSYPYEYLLDFNNELISAATDVNEMNWILSKSDGNHRNTMFYSVVYNKESSLQCVNSFYNTDNITTRLYHTEISYFLTFNQLSRYKHKKVILIFTSLKTTNAIEHNILRSLCDLLNHHFKLIIKNEIHFGINEVKICIDHILFYNFNPTDSLIEYAMKLSSSIFSDTMIHNIPLFTMDNLLIKLNSQRIIVRDLVEPNELYNYSIFIEHNDSSELNKLVDKIYCINLINNDKKLNNFINMINKHNISCEILRMTKLSDSKTYMELFDKIKNSGIEYPGELGCLLSHLICYKDAIHNNYKKIIIFEDDVISIHNLNEKIAELKDIINNKLLVYLGASQHIWSNTMINSKTYYYPYRTCGNFAILIDRIFILKIYDEVCKMKMKIDNIFFDKYNKDCIVMYPNLFICDVSESDIRETRNMKDFSNKMKWDLSKYNLFQT